MTHTKLCLVKCWKLFWANLKHDTVLCSSLIHVHVALAVLSVVGNKGSQKFRYSSRSRTKHGLQLLIFAHYLEWIVLHEEIVLDFKTHNNYILFPTNFKNHKVWIKSTFQVSVWNLSTLSCYRYCSSSGVWVSEVTVLLGCAQAQPWIRTSLAQNIHFNFQWP